MKAPLFALFTCLVFLALHQFAFAAARTGAADQLKELVSRIQTKLKAGENTEKDLSDNLKEFDALLAEHKSEKTDDVAQILLMEAMLYNQVLNNTNKGAALIERLKRDFPQTKVVESLRQQDEGKRIREQLAQGTKFPDFDEKDVGRTPLSIAKYKGKVVLLDFWATWCGPCVAELPNVLKTYEKHHANGFEIIGISLDHDEMKLTGFTARNNMTWPQFFDGKGWSNKLAVRYGVTSIPATYLLDREGKIIGRNLRGEALEAAVAAALARK